jgi:hypothetical protein
MGAIADGRLTSFRESRSKQTAEEFMEKFLCVCIFFVGAVTPMLNASGRRNRSKAFQRGTVLRVDQHQVQSPANTFGAGNPSDAPLASSFYIYDVSIHTNCGSYVGRYETPFKYLPSAFSPNNPIEVRPTKHVLYFDLPNDPDLRMSIVHRAVNKTRPCGTTNRSQAIDFHFRVAGPVGQRGQNPRAMLGRKTALPALILAAV